MAITFERADTIDDSIFDSLFATSLDDFKAGTFLYPDTVTTDEQIKQYTKETFITNQNTNTKHGILVKKDGVAINWIAGNHNPANTYTWSLVLNGAIDGSKAVFYTSEWHTNHKAYQESIGVSKYIIPCIKGSRVDTYFTQAQANGIMLGSYTKTDHSLTGGGNTVSHSWEY